MWEITEIQAPGKKMMAASAFFERMRADSRYKVFIMSEQTLTVNGKTAGAKKDDPASLTAQKTTFYRDVVVGDDARGGDSIYHMVYRRAGARTHSAAPAVGDRCCASGAVLLSFFGIFNMVLAIAGLPYLPWMKRQTYELINLLFPAAVRLGAIFRRKEAKARGILYCRE